MRIMIDGVECSMFLPEIFDDVFCSYTIHVSIAMCRLQIGRGKKGRLIITNKTNRVALEVTFYVQFVVCT